MKANFHTHTTRCGHATGFDREYVEAAIESGIKVLGFSDHVPQPFRSGYRSHIRMSVPETADYLASVHALAEEYKKDIRIYAGFEAEYFPDLFPEMMKTLSQYDYDYLIFGAHFIPDEVTGFYSGDATTSEADLKAYVDNVTEGLDTGVFTYLAHPDLINYHGPDDIYRLHMRKLCEKAKSLDIPLEINMNGLVTGRHYPNERFFTLAKECGNTFVVGVDAHSPEALKRKEDFQKTEDFLKKLNLAVIPEVPLRKPVYKN